MRQSVVSSKSQACHADVSELAEASSFLSSLHRPLNLWSHHLTQPFRKMSVEYLCVVLGERARREIDVRLTKCRCCCCFRIWEERLSLRQYQSARIDRN